MSRLISTTIYLNEDQIADIARISQKLNVPKAYLIRKGIDLAINWGEERIEMWSEAEKLVADKE